MGSISLAQNQLFPDALEHQDSMLVEANGASRPLASKGIGNIIPESMNPSHMWLGKFDLTPGDNLTGQQWPTFNQNEHNIPSSFFGQVTPPDDLLHSDQDSTPISAEWEAINPINGKRSSDGGDSARVRKDSRISTASTDGSIGKDGNKKEKYREKNRVAAAKCRAKKKVNVDNLEETHRTQSMLNTALRHTEQSLRDELSYWRMQALQHTFCECRGVQEYNMHKARNVAGVDNSHVQSDDLRKLMAYHQEVTDGAGVEAVSDKVHPPPSIDHKKRLGPLRMPTPIASGPSVIMASVEIQGTVPGVCT